MSGTEKSENCVTDSQDEYNEDIQKNVSFKENESISLNESQDFHLVDCEDLGEESLDKSASDLNKVTQIEKTTSASEKEDTDTKTDLEDIHFKIQDKSCAEDTMEKITVDTENTITNKSLEAEHDNTNVTCDPSIKERESEEEDEVIQSTPPHVHSPSKKINEVVSLKRKASFVCDTPSKLIKLSSEEDSFNGNKRDVEQEGGTCPLLPESLQEETSEKLCENVVIPETQDSIDDEHNSKVSQTPFENKDLVKECGKVLTNKDKTDNYVKDYCAVDKDENLNHSAVLSKITVSTDADKVDAVPEKVPDRLNDNNLISIDTKDNDTVSTAIEKDKCDLSNNESDDSLKIIKDTNLKEVSSNYATSDKNDAPESVQPTDIVLKDDSNIIKDDGIEKETTNTCKSRLSIEVIYNKTPAAQENKPKCTALVEIDESGEKIVLDSSQEDSQSKPLNKNIFDSTHTETTYKSCYESKSSSDFSYKSIDSTKDSCGDPKLDSKLTNGSTSESKRCDTDGTNSVTSEMFNNDILQTPSVDKQAKIVASKDTDNIELLSISDNEPDAFLTENNKDKSDIVRSTSFTKSLQIEKEIGVFVKLRCLLHIEEGTREIISKDLTAVHCESAIESSSLRQKNYDTSASLADISGNDNKDVSPGSVTSNVQAYPLNPSRLSLMSTVSSSSSASSAASLAAKLALKDNTHFSLPRGPAKHAKKSSHDVPHIADKQNMDETYEQLIKEWKNNRLLTTSVLNFLNAELNTIDLYSASNEKLDDQLQKIRSSTPEVHDSTGSHPTTPKSTRKGRALKRPRSKNIKSDNHANGSSKRLLAAPTPKVEHSNTPTNRKKSKTDTEADTPIPSSDTLQKEGSQDTASSDIMGKVVFAKWSDSNYYPGIVADKTKTKYKVNFYDGESKLLIQDFIIPIPKTLKEGLSVYVTRKNKDYGSCGIITDVQTVNNEPYYVVETDEGETEKVQIKDIFLLADQAQVLKEELNSEVKSLPSTPKHLAQVTLDNMVEGKRRSKRNVTPIFSTPKSRANHSTNKTVSSPEKASVSGISAEPKMKNVASSDSDDKFSESNISVKDETLLSGVQPEIIGTPNEQVVKGPQHRIKGKPRSKRKSEDKATIEKLGPIPHSNSTIFKGLSFILTCASIESLDRYQMSGKDSSSDTGTENEEEWLQKPFVRDRLMKQITAGGGRIYEEFDQIPPQEYKNTKLITNVPNSTAKSLLCLSVGIPAYSHKWIIRCCQQNKMVNPAEEELPAGWSLEKRSYVEMFQRPNNKPLTHVVIIIPIVSSEKQFATLWRQICENAGAVVLLVDKAESMEGFAEGTVIVSNAKCPTWAIEKATELHIPLQSTTWIVQCLIEGKLCPCDRLPQYKYTYIKK